MYVGSHLGFFSCHLENWANFDWLTRNFQIVHAYEHICQVSCLYPEVQDVYPFYILKLGYTVMGIPTFLVIYKNNIDCGYPLEMRRF